MHLSNGATPLHMAAQLPTSDHLAALLDAGADPNARGENDRPFLHLIGRDQSDTVRLLARHGADLNVVWGGGTPLMGSIMTYDWEIATTLLELGADVHYKDVAGHDVAFAFCDAIQGLPATERNRGVPALAKAFTNCGIHLPCARETDKYR